MKSKKHSLNINNLFIFLLIIISLILAGIVLSEDDSTNDNSEIKSDKGQRYVALNTKTLTYAIDGKLTYELYAKEVENFPETGQSLITAPELLIFDANKIAEWKITSNKATIDEKRDLNLIDNVVLKGLLDSSQIESIKSNTATINLNSQDILTTDKVTILGKGFQSEGTGLQGNIKAQHAKLLNDVISIYDPKLIKRQEKDISSNHRNKS